MRDIFIGYLPKDKFRCRQGKNAIQGPKIAGRRRKHLIYQFLPYDFDMLVGSGICGGRQRIGSGI
jgi:hypothetical protein